MVQSMNDLAIEVAVKLSVKLHPQGELKICRTNDKCCVPDQIRSTRCNVQAK